MNFRFFHKRESACARRKLKAQVEKQTDAIAGESRRDTAVAKNEMNNRRVSLSQNSNILDSRNELCYCGNCVFVQSLLDYSRVELMERCPKAAGIRIEKSHLRHIG